MNVLDTKGTPGDIPRKVQRFAERLQALQVPLAKLSPLEARLLEIIAPLFGQCIIMARVARPPIDDFTPAPLTEDVVAEGARYAVVAAVEIEQHLRKIREHTEKPR